MLTMLHGLFECIFNKIIQCCELVFLDEEVARLENNDSVFVA